MNLSVFVPGNFKYVPITNKSPIMRLWNMYDLYLYIWNIWTQKTLCTTKLKNIDLQYKIGLLNIEIKTSYIDIQQSTIDSHPYSVLIAKLSLPHASL